MFRPKCVIPAIVCVWLLSLSVSLVDQVMVVPSPTSLQSSNLAFIILYIPGCVTLIPCQVYLYLVASRHYR